MFTKNVLRAKDFAKRNLKGINNNKSLITLKGDRDLSIVIMKKPLIMVLMHQQMAPLLNI